MPDSAPETPALPAEPSEHAIWYPSGALALDPTPPQRRFLASDAPMLLAWGNRGGGKSLIARWKCHLRAMAHPGFRYAVIRRTLKELKNSVVADGLELEMDRLGGAYNRTESLARYPNGSTGLFIGIDDPEAMMRLLGGQYALIWFEELSLFDDWSTITRILSCLRTLKTDPFTAQAIATSNPFGALEEELFHRWIAKDVDLTIEPDYDAAEYEAIEMQRASNVYLDIEPYEKVLRRETNPAIRNAWLNGAWGNSSGTFFRFFPSKDDREWHVLKTLPEYNGRSIFRHPQIPVYRCLDWGFDDPCVCLWIAVMPNGRAIAIKELSQRFKQPSECAQEIAGHSRDMNIAATFADKTMFTNEHVIVSVGALFEREGVPLIRSANDRRMISVHEWLGRTIDGTPALQFWAEGVPTLISTIKKQRAKSKDPEYMADSSSDHHVCALSFFTSGEVAGHEPIETPKVPWWIAKQQELSARRPLGHEAVRRLR